MKKNVAIKSVGMIAGAGAVILTTFSSPAIASDGEDFRAVNDLVPILGTEQGTADIIPENIDLAAHSLDPVSTRYLGTDGQANYWVGLNRNSDVCMLANIPGGNDISASTCASAVDFNQAGLALLAGENRQDLSQMTEAYLLPEDVDVSRLPANAARPSGPYVATNSTQFLPVTPQSLPREDIEITREDGELFTFSPIILPEERNEP